MTETSNMNSSIEESMLTKFIKKNATGNYYITTPIEDRNLIERLNFGPESVSHFFQILGSKPHSKKVAGIYITDENISKIFYFEYIRNNNLNSTEFSFKQEVKTLSDIELQWEKRLDTKFPNHYF